MKKLYFIVPVIGVIVFGAFYWNFSSEIEQREHDKKEDARIERETKQRADLEAKKKAIEEAIALQEKRKVEKAEREKRLEEEKQVELAFKDAADKARDERDKILRMVDRLLNEIKTEEASLKKIAAEKDSLALESEFLLKYVKLAETNKASLEEILIKIETVDKEAAKAEARAKAAKSKSSS